MSRGDATTAPDAARAQVDRSQPGGPPPPSRRAAVLRLAALAAPLLAAYLAFFVFDLVDREDVRALVEPFGPLSAPAYVVVSALLGAALVPGPVLAGVSGILFGAALGTLVTICAATLNAVIALLIARRAAGPDALDAAGGPRVAALADLARRHGTVAVVVQRLAPWVPDAPCSYAFGAAGITVAQIALGTVIGALPRAFSYTALGASVDDPTSPLALAGFAGIVLTGVVGAEAIRRVALARRRSARAGDPSGRPPRAAGSRR